MLEHAGASERIVSALNRFSRTPLGTFPSPVRQARSTNGEQFWIKDDGGCSEIYGGNKVRKLEYLLAIEKHCGHRALVVHGDIESHTVQACGLLGRHVGLEIHAVVFSHNGQSFDGTELGKLQRAGVRIHRCESMLKAILWAHWIGWRIRASVVPLGASTPSATLGHVRAALELLEQVRQGELPEPRRLYIPFATGGSVAGLLIGLAMEKIVTEALERTLANRDLVIRTTPFHAAEKALWPSGLHATIPTQSVWPVLGPRPARPHSHADIRDAFDAKCIVLAKNLHLPRTRPRQLRAPNHSRLHIFEREKREPLGHGHGAELAKALAEGRHPSPRTFEMQFLEAARL